MSNHKLKAIAVGGVAGAGLYAMKVPWYYNVPASFGVAMIALYIQENTRTADFVPVSQRDQIIPSKPGDKEITAADWVPPKNIDRSNPNVTYVPGHIVFRGFGK